MDYQQLSIYSVVASAILFAAVIIWGFNKYLTPAVLSAQKARNEEIAEAEKRRDEAVRLATKLREEHVKLTAALAETRVRAEAEAKHERERILAEARHEGERLVHHADGELDRARVAAQAELQTRLMHLALEKARARAYQEVNTDVDSGITKRFLDQLEQKDRRLAEVNGG